MNIKIVNRYEDENGNIIRNNYSSLELSILDDINTAINNEQLSFLTSSQKIVLMNNIINDDGLWQQFNENMDDVYGSVRDGVLDLPIISIKPFVILK